MIDINPRGTAYLRYLEEENRILQERLRLYERVDLPKGSVFEEPSMMEMPELERTLKLAVSLEATKNHQEGYHIITRTTGPEYVSFGYYISEMELMQNSGLAKEASLAEYLHKQVIFDLIKFFRYKLGTARFAR